MKPKAITILLTVAIVASGAMVSGADKPIQTRIGPISVKNGYPTKESVQKLYDEMDFQRATQAYVWAIPLVSFQSWYVAQQKQLGAKDGEFVIFQTPAEKKGILTANGNTPYFISFADLGKTGPLVLEVPAGATAGGIGDFWQRGLVDLGAIGPNKGTGGKFLILPPDMRRNIADGYLDGHNVVTASANHIMLGIRMLDASDMDKALALGRKLKLYPYEQRENPPATRFKRAGDTNWNGKPVTGLKYFEYLSDYLNSEPVVDTRDRIMWATLIPLGIEKGKKFNPNPRQKKILEEAAILGEQMLRANDYDRRVARSVYLPDCQWEVATCNIPTTQEGLYHTFLDERSAWFYEAVTLMSAMTSHVPGFGQAYLGAYRDADGAYLDGGKNYSLTVSANPPAKRFWAVTLYDNMDRLLLVNKQGRSTLSSQNKDMVKNADGGVTLHFGPKPPKDKKLESNWIQTNPGQGWFTYFRLYGPEEAYLNRTWKPNDIKREK